MKKNKISKNWINQQKKDVYVRQSKVDGYRARSVYKLIEIDQKFKIFKKNMLVVDIGAAPGSWSQFVSKIVNSGDLISVDLKQMDEINNNIIIKGDFTDENIKKKIKTYFKRKPDVIISDMAVNTTGIKSLDSLQTGELCKQAIYFARDSLSDEGSFISKIFMGVSFNEIVALAKKIFTEVKVFKPKSSRKESKESFIVCKKIRQPL